MSRRAGVVAVLAGCGLVLLADLALFGAAAWNRRGEPRAELLLTERELALPDDRREESAAIFLSLRASTRTPETLERAAWARRADRPRVELPWLDREKLRRLGFRVGVEPDDPAAAAYYRGVANRRVWLALEYEGEAWQSWLAGREAEVARMRQEVEAGAGEAYALAEAEARLAFDRLERSRLFPVDAERDAETLERRYAGRGRFVVVPALVRPLLHDPQDGPPVIRGWVHDLLGEWIYVPRGHRPLLEPLLPSESASERNEREQQQARLGWPTATPPRFHAGLVFGRRHEPWLVRVESAAAAD